VNYKHSISLFKDLFSSYCLHLPKFNYGCKCEKCWIFCSMECYKPFEYERSLLLRSIESWNVEMVNNFSLLSFFLFWISTLLFFSLFLYFGFQLFYLSVGLHAMIMEFLFYFSFRRLGLSKFGDYNKISLYPSWFKS
jgi:hypothetical protein